MTENESRWHAAWQKVTTGNAIISVFALLLAMLVGSIMIVATDVKVLDAFGYFFARPGDTFRAIGEAVGGAYSSLFQGSIYNFRVDSFEKGIRPLTETLNFATPLIAAGLGVGLAFRVGMFNIGGRGQMLVAASAAGWVSWSFPMPAGLHLLFAVLAGMLAGALWAGIAGFLKARTGAHEVIVTIMLNYIGYYLISWMLATPGLLQAPGSNNPKTPAALESAQFPKLLGPNYNVHLGLLVALLAVVVVWWLLNRSQLGFQMRAVGQNPSAAKVAGINVSRMYLYGMLIAGALVGLAGVSQVLGTVTSGFGSGIDAGVGFDAITVALLGRSNPVGILLAALLFGALKAGGFAMQAANGIPIDIVLVVQSLIVLFIAAPPLIRTLFRLPDPERARSRAAQAEVSK
ncbi:MAG TPA: ABC transporter permease [Microbacteriaceae bacterium]|nr:ABC transporter permease [Microbacteriaceae bacterium]